MSNKGLLSIRAEIDTPIFLPAGGLANAKPWWQIVPEIARNYYIYNSAPNSVPLRWKPATLQQQDDPREFSWSPQFALYDVAIDILALDRKIEVSEFKLEPRLAEKHLSNTVWPYKSTGSWRLVAVITQQDAKYVEFSFDGKEPNHALGKSVVFASLEEILLVAPNNEVVGRIRY
jgi:hypothetical protein